MKAAQNDETNPNTQSARPPHVPSIANMQFSPSSPKTRNTGNTFQDVSPLRRYHHCRVRAHLASLIVMSCIIMLMFLLYLLFLPPLLSLDIETDAAVTQYDYGVNDPSLPEQPGKPPSPLITRYRLFFSILLALE